MFYNSQTLTSSHLLQVNQDALSSKAPCQQQVLHNADHLTYISGKKAELWRQLVKQGIIDSYGNLTEAYVNFKLPALNDEEYALIQVEFEKTFQLNLGLGIESPPLLSIKDLIVYLQNQIPQKSCCKIQSIHIIGGYVHHLLFSITNYAKRVFEELGARLESGWFNLRDIDCRIHIIKKENGTARMTKSGLYIPYNKKILNQDLSDLSSCIMKGVVHHVAGLGCADEKEISHTLFEHAFNNFCTVFTPQNQFLVIALKNSLFDLVFFASLARFSVFNLDDLFLPVQDFFASAQETPQKCIPCSFRKTPFASFIQLALGIIYADQPETIDEFGWLRFISLTIKGNCSFLPCQGEQMLEGILFAKMCESWKKANKSIAFQLRIEMKKWIFKHHTTPSEYLFFLLQACSYLDGAVANTVAQLILDVDLSPRIAKSELGDLIKMIISHKMPIYILYDFLQICCFLRYLGENTSSVHLNLEIGSTDFKSPTFLLNFEGATLHLPCNPVTALLNLKASQIRFAEKWLEVEETLFDLLLLICPPSTLHPALDAKKIMLLGVELEPLLNASISLATSDSPLLNYMGIVHELVIPTENSEARRSRAEENFLSVMKLKKSAEIKELLEAVIGKKSLPAFDSQHLEQEWIEALFAEGRNSVQLAIKLCKKMLDQNRGILFFFRLIHKLLSTQHHAAHMLFCYLHKSTKFLNFRTETLSLIFAFKTLCQNNCAQKHYFLNSIYLLDKVLIACIDAHNEPFEPQYENKIIEYGAWLHERKEYAFLDKMYAACQKKPFLHLWKQQRHLVLDAKISQGCFQEVHQILKDALDNQVLPDTLWQVLVGYCFAEPNGVDPALEELFWEQLTQKKLSSSDQFIFFIKAKLESNMLSFGSKLKIFDRVISQGQKICDALCSVVLECCQKHLEQSSKMDEVIDWLAQTDYFAHIKTRATLQNFLNKCVKEMIEKQNWPIHTDCLFSFVNTYLKDLLTLTPGNWFVIFQALKKTHQVHLNELFKALDEHKAIDYLKNEQHTCSYHTLFLYILVTLNKLHSKALVDYVLDQKKMAAILNNQLDQTLRFDILCNLLLGCAPFAHENVLLFPLLKNIHQQIISFLDSSQQNSNNTEEFYKQLGGAERIYFKSLLFSKSTENVKYALKILSNRVGRKLPISYWSACVQVLEFFIYTDPNDSLDTFHLLIKNMDSSLYDTLEKKQIFSFLDYNYSNFYAHKVLQIWHILKINHFIFPEGMTYKIIKLAIVNKIPSHEEQIKQSLLLLTLNDVTNVAYMELSLLFYSSRALEHVPKLRMYLRTAIDNLQLIPPGEKFYELHLLILKSILHIAKAQIVDIQYYIYTYFERIGVALSYTRFVDIEFCDTKQLRLPLKECFEIKSKIIQVLLDEAKQQSPRTVLLLRAAYTFIKSMQKAPLFKVFKKEISELMRVYEEHPFRKRYIWGKIPTSTLVNRQKPDRIHIED